MKKTGYGWLSFLLGGLTGWVSGYLRVPYIEQNDAFWLGAGSGVSFLALVLFLLNIPNKARTHVIKDAEKINPPYPKVRTLILIRVSLIGIVVATGLAFGWLLYHRNGVLAQQLEQREKHIQSLETAIQAQNSNNLSPLMHQLLNDIEQELRQHPQRQLRDTTIARIAALSAAFRPYPCLQSDTASNRICSPERGQLLKALLLLRMHPATLNRIWRAAPFDGADLQGADLQDTDLSHIRLASANLKEADLRGAKLQGANLEKAVLWGADLSEASLDSTLLRRADLRWARLNKAIIRHANLDGTLLHQAQLMQATISNSSWQWAQAEGVLMNEAQLTSVNNTGTNFTRSNWKNARLLYSDWRKINLSQADLTDIQLDRVLIDDSWQKHLTLWGPFGLQTLENGHIIAGDTVDKGKKILYRYRRK